MQPLIILLQITAEEFTRQDEILANVSPATTLTKTVQ